MSDSSLVAWFCPLNDGIMTWRYKTVIKRLFPRTNAAWTLGRSENQNSQKINNAECFFCVLVYKEQGKLQLV